MRENVIDSAWVKGLLMTAYPFGEVDAEDVNETSKALTLGVKCK